MNRLLTSFIDHVALKYHLYNSLFMTLPFAEMSEVATLLTLFSQFCAKEIQKNQHPEQIVKKFFQKNNQLNVHQDKFQLLFKMLQFVEREIVLFDALEDSAFTKTHLLTGPGSLHNFLTQVVSHNLQEKYLHEIKNYRVRIALTAHPTQFYPDSILGIIDRLAKAIQKEDLKNIRDLLLQMGKTSFKHREKPTPYEEAVGVVWYLEHVFYRVVPYIQKHLVNTLEEFSSQVGLFYSFSETIECSPWLQLGFWPGGDRDGNPSVTPEITMEVAKLLKKTILKKYLEDLNLLIKKLTFEGILPLLQAIQLKLENTLFQILHGIENNFERTKYIKGSKNKIKLSAHYKRVNEFINDLMQVRKKLIIDHDELFLEHLDFFILKIQCFGFHFAMIDMRENAAIHHEAFCHLVKESDHIKLPELNNLKNYEQLPEANKINLLKMLISHREYFKDSKQFKNKNLLNLFSAIEAIKHVQQQNGESGLCRYIISNSGSVTHVLELLALFYLSGHFTHKISVDIIPLFESIQDLEASTKIMETLYQCDVYLQHVRQRNDTQIIMLGFSDGTKDGGYVTANWSIYKAKIKLTELAKKYQLKVIFFDGRGGPPARGGGNTRSFYRSLGSKINHHDLQLTVQGQTVSSNFGTFDSAKYNLEQLFTAGLDDLVFVDRANDLSAKQIELLEALSLESKNSYDALRESPLFVPYLEEITPLPFYGELNIGSRPVSRKKSDHLKFSDLRAIPFVGACSQLRQNIPGYYGFGSALKKLLDQGKKSELQHLYKCSLLFRTLVENAMMSLCKTFFPLTAYLKEDKKYGQFWQQLFNEANLTAELLKLVSGQKELLENDCLNRESIKIREKITLPLLVIQQFALTEIRQLEQGDKKTYKALKEIILKALATNTNASRNSA